jgi:[histone H3]-lysine36 N-dimethyltransferase SETMAR
LPHPPYSPDLAPSDYHLFRDMTVELRKCGGMKFKSDSDVKTFVEQYFHSKNSDFFRYGIEKLPKLWNACIKSEGCYFDRIE